MSRSGRGLLFETLGRFGLLFFLAVMVVGFSLAAPTTFATTNNYEQILDAQTVVVIAALATMLPLIVGEFDLSIGATAGLSNIIAVALMDRHGTPVGVAILIALAAATVVGLVNGLLVVKLKVTAMVATLGTLTIMTGLGLWITGSTDLLGAPGTYTNLARTEILGIRLTVFYAAIIAGVLFVALARMPLGRRLFAVGANRKAAELSGIRSERFVIGSFTAAGTLAGLAGVLLGAQLGTASNASLLTLLLPSFAAAFLGATAINPGRFNVWGTVIAAYFLSVTLSGLQQVGAPTWVEPVFNGVVLIFAVATSEAAQRLRTNRARNEQLQLLHRGSAGGADAIVVADVDVVVTPDGRTTTT